MKCTFAPIGAGRVRCTACGLVVTTSHAPEHVHATCGAAAGNSPPYGGGGARRSPTAPPPPPMTAASLPCVHRGDGAPHPTGCDLCGGRGQPFTVYQCALHGKCSVNRKHSQIKSCVACAEREAPPPPPPLATVDFTAPVRHLACHIWPVHGTGAWQWNCDQLLARADLFDGRRIVSIVTSPEADHPEVVQDYLRSFTNEFVILPNNRHLREVITWIPMLDRLEPYQSDQDVTFACHSKAASHNLRPDANGTTLFRWAQAMYDVCLDWPAVEAALQTHATAGAFRRYGASQDGGWGPWHWTGAFHWFRNRDAFARKWRNLPQYFFGTEAWPGLLFTPQEAAVLLTDNVQDLYDLAYWESEIEPKLAVWKAAKLKLSILIPTIGRETLIDTLDSLRGQLHAADEVLVLADGPDAAAGAGPLIERSAVNCRLLVDGPYYNWANPNRDAGMAHATGDILLFMDDDDVYSPGALDKIRRAASEHPGRVLIFKMLRSGGDTIWTAPEVVEGNVGTPMIVVPNDPTRLGSWGSRYEGDFDFLRSTLALHGTDPVFIDEVVCTCRPRDQKLV